MTVALRLRPMTPADIPAGLHLCRTAHWNQVDEDWRRFLTLNPDGARVALDESGSVVGTVAWLDYAGGCTWLAMVLVDPACRGQGIASRLVQDALDTIDARGETSIVRLDATPAGEALYRKLAFEPECALMRMERDPAPASYAAALPHRDGAQRLGELTDDDLAEVIALDREVFGADRSMLLKALRREQPGYARVLRHGSSLAGFAFGRRGFRFDHIGPLIARDEETAFALLTSILSAHPATAFILDVPQASASWLAGLASVGFREQRPFVRFVRGARAGGGSHPKLFATIGADFG